MNERLSTGNEYISVPDIIASKAGIQGVGFLHEGFRACVELHGSDDMPLLEPVLELKSGTPLPCQVGSKLISYWIPSFSLTCGSIRADAAFFAPLERRGLVGILKVENGSDSPARVRAGWRGCWEKTFHAANLRKRMVGVKYANISSWQAGVPVIEYRGHTPLFAMALLTEDAMPARLRSGDGDIELTDWTAEGISAAAGVPIFCDLTDEFDLGPHESRTIPVYVGFGLEEVSAVASARDLRLHGSERLFAHLKTWLDNRTIQCSDERLKWVMNVNSFYNYFFAQGITLDTERLVMACARASSSDSCAAYRDHDAVLWSLPAVLQVNWAQARKMLIYAFTTQLANVGLHSRFIDGVALEPGLQLDQLCAPIRALRVYVELTGDMSVLFDRRVQAGVNTIQQILAAQRHPDVALFETLLLPSGEPSRYPYVCYSNVLVWRVLQDVSWLYDRIRDIDRSEEASHLCAQVRDAIWEHFVVEGPLGQTFAFSADLEGNHELGDDPAGSLQLLTYYEFCEPDHPVYANTLAWIHSEHNPLSGFGRPFETPSMQGGRGPSFIGVINDLLTHRKEAALDFLRRAELDHGIACETIDPETGAAAGGLAFASCAGFLAFALRIALGAEPPERAIETPKRRPSETLYEPPPEMSQDVRKARL